MRGDDDAVAVVAVGHDPGHRSQQENRNLADECDHAKQQGGAGKPVNQPVLGDVLHPGAHQRDKLAAKEELKISMTQRPDGGAQAYPLFGVFLVTCILRFRRGHRFCHDILFDALIL